MFCFESGSDTKNRVVLFFVTNDRGAHVDDPSICAIRGGGTTAGTTATKKMNEIG